MKQRQRAHLTSMGWKRNTVRKRGDTQDRVKSDETTSVGLTRILLDQKIKKIHSIDSTVINEQ
jgi:hypothetical protein